MGRMAIAGVGHFVLPPRQIKLLKNRSFNFDKANITRRVLLGLSSTSVCYRTPREQMRYNEKMTTRWSMAYFATAWTVAGLVFYKALQHHSLMIKRFGFVI